jgi:hypothetical protein
MSPPRTHQPGVNTYASLSYTGGAQVGAYGNISIQDINPASGQPIGNLTTLEPHLSGGSQGLIDMRDQVLGGLSQSLGNWRSRPRWLSTNSPTPPLPILHPLRSPDAIPACWGRTGLALPARPPLR